MTFTPIPIPETPSRGSEFWLEQKCLRGLWAATLYDAVIGYVKGNVADRFWIEDKGYDEYSFRWVCECLNLNPDIVLEKLQAQVVQIRRRMNRDRGPVPRKVRKFHVNNSR